MRTVATLITGLALTGGLTAVAAPAHAAPEIIKSTVNQVECTYGITGTTSEVTFGSSYVVGVDDSVAEARVLRDEVIVQRGFVPYTWGPSLDVSVPLTTPDRTPTGTFSIRMALTPDEPRVEVVDEWDGNLHTTGTITTTDYQVRVDAVSLTDATLSPEGWCSASTIVWDTQNNNPQYHQRQEINYVSDPCGLKGMGPSEIYVRNDVKAPMYSLRVHRGGAILAADDQLVRRRFVATDRHELVDMETGETAGTARVNVQFLKSGRSKTEREVDGNTTVVTRRTPYTMNITVRTSAGELGRSTCAATEVAEWTTIKRY